MNKNSYYRYVAVIMIILILYTQEGCQGPFHPSGRNSGLPLRRRGGQGPHLAKRWEPRGFSRLAAGFSSYEKNIYFCFIDYAKASRKQSSLSGKESAQGCISKRLLGRPD